MMLQYPIYGGIMGIMDTTGLAAMISKGFVAIATQHTLPFWTYFASCSSPSSSRAAADTGRCRAPSPSPRRSPSAPRSGHHDGGGDGRTGVQHDAAVLALPVVAMAGIGIQRVLGFTVVTFAVTAVIYGAALLVLA